MANIFHKDYTPAQGIHIPYAFTYADTSTREAATGFLSGDVGKLARQLDNNSLWMLTATTPVWQSIGGSADVYSAVSSADTSPGYLSGKIQGTSGKISTSIGTPGGNEKLLLTIGADVFDKTVNTLDNISEGTTYGKVKLLSLTTGEVDHTRILNTGTNSHAQIDTAISNSVSHIADTNNPHSVTALQIGLGNVTNDAQLKRAAGDFATFISKISPVGSDILLIEDSAGGGAKKQISLSSLSAFSPVQTVDGRTGTVTLSDLYAPIAKGVTNGDSHDHNGGNGGQIDHSSLSGIGTNTHSQIDTAISLSTSHLANTSNPHNTTATQVGLGNVTNDAQLKRAAGDFATFTDKTSPIGADILLIEDSAAGGAKKRISISNLPAGTPIFGSQFNFAESAGESSTTSISYVNKVTLSMTGLPGGNYYLSAYCEMRCSTGSVLIYAEMKADGNQWAESVLRPSNSSEYPTINMVDAYMAMSAGDHTITLNYKTASNTAYIRNARIVFWRVS